jgi:hypothetical protein
MEYLPGQAMNNIKLPPSDCCYSEGGFYFGTLFTGAGCIFEEPLF